MSLTKARGNMYDWVTHHWNPIKGECSHRCDYCYVDYSRAVRFYQGPCRLDEKDLETSLGMGKRIFVGSMNDMWADDVPVDWIARVLDRCCSFNGNSYVFQSKNPSRFHRFMMKIPFGSLLGTTIETDQYPYGFETSAPKPKERAASMRTMPQTWRTKFVTIEPIMDFELQPLLKMIRSIKPEFVTIGADSKGNGLFEPSWEKVEELIHGLGQFTEVRQKTNLERLKK